MLSLKTLTVPMIGLVVASSFLTATPAIAAPNADGPRAGLITRDVRNTEGSKYRDARAAKDTLLSGSSVLIVQTQKQATNYYCAPASGRVALSALVLGPVYPTQANIAGRMGTTTSGTSINNIAPALNTYQSKNKYVTATGTALSGYRDRVRWGIQTYKAPPVNAVQMSRLPWYAGTGIAGGHATATYGLYESGTTYNHYVFDPWDNIRHYTTSAAMWSASINGTLIW